MAPRDTAVTPALRCSPLEDALEMLPCQAQPPRWPNGLLPRWDPELQQHREPPARRVPAVLSDSQVCLHTQ